MMFRGVARRRKVGRLQTFSRKSEKKGNSGVKAQNSFFFLASIDICFIYITIVSQGGYGCHSPENFTIIKCSQIMQF